MDADKVSVRCYRRQSLMVIKTTRPSQGILVAGLAVAYIGEEECYSTDVRLQIGREARTRNRANFRTAFEFIKGERTRDLVNSFAGVEAA